jgi:hypothetical protein
MRDQFNAPLCLLLGVPEWLPVSPVSLMEIHLGRTCCHLRRFFCIYDLHQKQKTYFIRCGLHHVLMRNSQESAVVYPYSVLVSDKGTATVRPSRAGQVITAVTLCSLVVHY